MKKGASNSTAIHPLIKGRRSLVGFSSCAIPEDVLLRIFEAARWSPSWGNEQPWRFRLATRDDPMTFSLFFSLLAKANQDWAVRVPILCMAGIEPITRRHNRRNLYGWFDLGQAIAFLTVQAQHEGISIHQIGAFDRERAERERILPEPVEPVVMFAMGYPNEEDLLPEALNDRDRSTRERLPLEDLLIRT